MISLTDSMAKRLSLNCIKRVVTLLLLVIISSTGCKKILKLGHSDKEKQHVLKVAVINFYSSDSLKKVVSEILDDEDIQVDFITFESSADFAVSLNDSENKPDVVLGLKSTDLFFLRSDIFAPVDKLTPEKNKGKKNSFYVFGHNYLTILYNKNLLKDVPQTYAQLTDDSYGNCFILFDPDKSDLGRDFIIMTASSFGNAGMDLFWRGFKGNILRLEDNWKNANLRFLAEEVPFITGYLSEAAFHNAVENDKRFSAIYFPEGIMKVDFGCAKLKSPKKSENADKLIRALLSKEIQKKLPSLIWMYPELKDYQTPGEMYAFPQPAILTEAKREEIGSDLAFRDTIARWRRITEFPLKPAE